MILSSISLLSLFLLVFLVFSVLCAAPAAAADPGVEGGKKAYYICIVMYHTVTDKNNT